MTHAATAYWLPDPTGIHENGKDNGRQQRLTQAGATAPDRRMSARKTRNVSLTPELEAFIDARVAAGRYRSASEIVRVAPRLLEHTETDRRKRGEDPLDARAAATPREQ